MPQNDDGVVLKGIDTHSAVQMHSGRRFIRCRAFGTHRIGQKVGPLLFTAFTFAAITSGLSISARAGVATAIIAASRGFGAIASVTASIASVTAALASVSFRFLCNHTCRSIKGYRAARRDLGSVRPFAVNQNNSVVLHIADQYGCADLHLGGVSLGIFHCKMQAVPLRGFHNGLCTNIDRTVRRFRTRRLCGRNNDILPNSDIGVVVVGKDAYAGAEAKS